MTNSQSKNKAQTVAKKAFWISIIATLVASLGIVCFGAGGLAPFKILSIQSAPLLKCSKFLLFTGVTFASVVIISGMVGLLYRIGFKWKKEIKSEDGVILLEFVLLLPILLFLVLVMVQSSLIMGGYLNLNYASFCAARTAIVQVPRNLSDEPRNTLASYDDATSSEKLSNIKFAAVWALIPTGATDYSATSENAGTIISGIRQTIQATGGGEPAWLDSMLASKISYVEDNTTVTVQPPIIGYEYGEHEDIRITVTHNLYLNVPLAGRFFAALDSNSVEIDNGKRAVRIKIPCAMPNEGKQDWIDTEQFPD